MLTVKRSADQLYHLSVPYLHPEPPSSAVLHLCKVSMEVLHLTHLRAAYPTTAFVQPRQSSALTSSVLFRGMHKTAHEHLSTLWGA